MSSALAAFQPHQPRLLRIAYRMLGTMSDAEDVVQDAYLRWHEHDREAVRSDEAFLVTTVTRLAIDRLRRLKTERESYFGSWLPEPWTGSTEVASSDDISYAALVLLERLGPEERAAFLLREIFDMDYALIAESLDKTEATCRKLVQRAKEHLAADDELAQPRHEASRESHRLLVEQLLAATRAEDAVQLERMLVAAVQLVSDGGGKVFAARYVLEGAARVTRALWRFVHKVGAKNEERVVDLAGEPVIVTYLDGALYGITFVATRAGQIESVYKVFNPDKLRLLAAQLPPL
jgi:RNA polymerase sigma-70 factor (ECF subfamily)